MLRRIMTIMVFLLSTSAACAPAAAPVVVRASPTVPATATALPTQTQMPADSPTARATPLLTETFTPAPSSTFTAVPVLLPSATSRAVKRKPSVKPSPTGTATLTEPAPSPTYTSCPLPTPEPLWVEPVTSPTDQLSQHITVRVGYGTEVTISTESGTFTLTGSFDAYANPALVEIMLLPDTVHHLEISVRIQPPPGNDCSYGSYTLHTTQDRNGAPLLIVQGTPAP